MFVFEPIGLAMSEAGAFELQHEAGDAEVAIAWRRTAAEVRWALVDSDLERTTRGDEVFVTVEFDRFGYFMIVTPERSLRRPSER